MKNFIRGMGVGIIITTLVLGIAYMLNGNNMSEDEIRNRAKQLGMVQQETTVIKQQEMTKEVTPQATVSDAVNSGAASDAASQISDLESGEPQNAVQKAEETPSTAIVSGDSVIIQIQKGQDGITISQMLQDNGIVADAMDFNRYLSENRLQMQILWGEFELHKNMSYEEIADKIIAGKR